MEPLTPEFGLLEEIILREMEDSRLVGLAITLVRGREIVWSRGYGCEDVEGQQRVAPASVFSAQSVSKPIVATALMQWYERGYFRLDDPVNDHLAPVRLQNEFEDKAPITVRQLLTHTGGLPVDIGVSIPPPTQPRPLEQHISTVVKTVGPPGGEIVYANWGYDTIGYLIERFAGQPYDEYLRDHILVPLGMRSSAIGAAPEGASVAKGHFVSAVDRLQYRVEPPPWSVEPPNPAGSLFSTVEDLARFLITHLNGGVYEDNRILEADTVAEMHRLHTPAGASNSGMGLGFRVDRSHGRHLICHGGDGWGYTVFIGGYPEEKVGVVLAINTANAQTPRSVIATAALSALSGEDSLHEASVHRGRSREDYRLAGAYRSTYWDIEAEITVEDGAPIVSMVRGFIVQPGGDRSRLLQITLGVYRAQGGFFDGSHLAFEFGDDGKASRFYGGVYPFQFNRQGDIPASKELAVDERADLVGRWSGKIETPIGSLPVVLVVIDSRSASVTALSARDAVVEEVSAERGHVSGRFDVTVLGLGAFAVFLRLNASGDKLQGLAYARGGFGEFPLSTELARE